MARKARTKAASTYELVDGQLWPNTPSGNPLAIEVFGATGEYVSGKTLLGLSIAPGAHPENHKFAGQPRTLLLDFEKSACTYGGTGCERVDVPLQLLEKYEGKYGPLHVFTWFQDKINKVEQGQYDVIMADPITDVESGLVEYVKKNHAQFSLTRNQLDKSPALLWGAVKDYWKQVLLKLSTRCQCFYFTSHLRDVWQDNRPVRGKREPKGKETLMELASLYVWLQREPDESGNIPAVPSAVCEEPHGKNRISDTWIDDQGKLHITPLLPPRIPVCTAETIRQYIANPPDYRKLKDDERVPEQQFTDEERLRLQVAKAEAERDTEESRVQQLQRRAELTTAQAQAKVTSREISQKEIDQAKQEAEAAVQKTTARAKEIAAGAGADGPAIPPPAERTGENGGEALPNGKATRSQVQAINRLFKVLDLDGVKQSAILGRVNVELPEELTRSLANLLIEKMSARAKAKEAAEPVTTAAGN